MKKLLFLLPLLLVGCKLSQTIAYRTDNIAAPNEVVTIPIIVNVRLLEDHRLQNSENTILFTNPRQTYVKGINSCINSEQHYKKDSVSSQMTKLMVEHFNKVKLFRYAVTNSTINFGYYLTGTITSLYGEQEFSKGAMIGSQFGLVGALATAGIKTPGKIIIEVDNIKLYKDDGILVKDLGNFYKEYSEDLSADAYCWCIYRNINDKLKDFNSHLAEKIRSELLETKF